MEVKNKEIIIAIILGIAELLVNIIAYFKENYFLYLMQLGISITLIVLIIMVFIKYIITKKQYKFIEYLYFGSEYNKFNFFPKLVIYMNYLNKKNHVDVDELYFICHSINNDKEKRTEFSWTLHNVSNNTRRTINEYFLYTTSDIGKTGSPKIAIKEGNQELKFVVNNIKKSNGIQMSPFAFTSPLLAGTYKNDVSIFMTMYDAFDFSSNEIVYLYPRNYGKNVGCMNVTLKLEGINNMAVSLHEIGKEGDGYVDKPLRTGIAKKEGRIECYHFHLDKKEINMSSMYYLLLSAIEPNKLI